MFIRLMTILSFAIVMTLHGGLPAVAQSISSGYLQAAQALRQAAAAETDPILRQQYLMQADQLELNARALESTAPAFVPGGSASSGVQPPASPNSMQGFNQGQWNRNSCGGRVCATLAP